MYKIGLSSPQEYVFFVVNSSLDIQERHYFIQ